MGSLSCPRATGVSCPPGVRVASCSAMLRGCDKPRRKPPFSSVEARNRGGHPDDEPNQDHGRGRGRGPRAGRHGRRGGPRADQHACARTDERLSTQLRSTQMLVVLATAFGPLRAVELLERLCGLEGVLAVLGGCRSPRVPPWRPGARTWAARRACCPRRGTSTAALGWWGTPRAAPSRTRLHRRRPRAPEPASRGACSRGAGRPTTPRTHGTRPPRWPAFLVDYFQHGRTFPNQRANAGPDQSCSDFTIILGKVRPFTSPDRGPSTGSDHCSSMEPAHPGRAPVIDVNGGTDTRLAGAQRGCGVGIGSTSWRIEPPTRTAGDRRRRRPWVPSFRVEITVSTSVGNRVMGPASFGCMPSTAGSARTSTWRDRRSRKPVAAVVVLVPGTVRRRGSSPRGHDRACCGGNRTARTPARR